MHNLNLQFKMNRYGITINKRTPNMLSIIVNTYGPRKNTIDYFGIYFKSSNARMIISVSSKLKSETIIYVMGIKE